jgi:hypothetical protein
MRRLAAPVASTPALHCWRGTYRPCSERDTRRSGGLGGLTGALRHRSRGVHTQARVTPLRRTSPKAPLKGRHGADGASSRRPSACHHVTAFRHIGQVASRQLSPTCVEEHPVRYNGSGEGAAGFAQAHASAQPGSGDHSGGHSPRPDLRRQDRRRGVGRPVVALCGGYPFAVAHAVRMTAAAPSPSPRPLIG